MDAWRQVELAACEELPGLLGDDGPSAEELDAIRGAAFTVEEVDERELVTEHDLAAFVDVLASSVGEAGRWIHFGLTSSDVLDTALALQLRAAGEVIVAGARSRSQALAARAREHVGTLTVGRTHGVHAEPTTLRDQARGLRLRGRSQRRAAAARLRRGRSRRRLGGRGHLRRDQPRVRGARPRAAGARARGRLDAGRPPRPPRQLLCAIALAGAGLERFATEVRHLQRTEVRELQEPFRAGQKGSSSMPHKRNPIKSEQIAGLARVLRGNAQAALENVALWHERDISHSSVERVILPDSTILLDYMQQRTIALVRGMSVDVERMRANLELTHGALFSQRVLLALVEAGSPRDEAYQVVKELAQRAWDRASRCASCSPPTSVPAASTSTRSSTTSHYVRHARRDPGAAGRDRLSVR